MRLALVIPSLAGGGAERTLRTLVDGLVRRGHEVTVVTTTSRQDFFSLPQGVRRLSLDLTGAPPGEGTRLKALPRTAMRLPGAIARLRTTLRGIDADLYVAFMEHAAVLTLLVAGRSMKVVVTEHADPRHLPVGRVWRVLRRILYPRALRLVSVSTGVDREFDWLDDSKRLVIGNPVPDEAIVAGARNPAERAPTRRIVAMGRLSWEKGFDLLVEAFGATAAIEGGWTLTILGEGPERQSLEKMIHAKGLGDRIRMPGIQANPFDLLTEADFFVVPSRSEGFGNAIAEALACRLPVISFDCPSGPRDIVEHDVNGWLIPPGDTGALAAAIDELTRDHATLSRLSAAAADSVAHLRTDHVVDLWESHVLSLVDPTKGRRR